MEKMIEMLKRMYDYNKESNLKFIDLIKAHSIEDEYIRKNFSHLLTAQHIWMGRIFDFKSSYKLWEIHPIKDLESINSKNTETSLKIIEIESLDRKIAYTNTLGNSYVNTIHEILLHIINHATYHRAQVAAKMRQIDIVPPNSDLIAYYRK
jgi:uncharacterized damage-inducible protein DinB